MTFEHIYCDSTVLDPGTPDLFLLAIKARYGDAAYECTVNQECLTLEHVHCELTLLDSRIPIS